jgi:integrase
MSGTVERRGKNSWRIRVPAGYEGGKKQWISETIKYPSSMSESAQRKAANKALNRLAVRVERGEAATGPQMTLEAFATQWMEYKRQSLSPVTYANYQGLLNGRILPALGQIKLHSIKPATLVKFYQQLQAPGGRKDRKPKPTLSGKTVRLYHGLLSVMLATAVQWQLIPYNPTDRVAPPKKDTPEMRYYTPEEAGKALAALEGEPVEKQAWINLALFGGLRLGEIAGLEWQHVDFGGSCVHVRQSSKYLSGVGLVTKEPKTASGRRDVTLPAHVMALLRTHKREQAAQRLQVGSDWVNSGRVFCQWDGKPMHPDTPSKWWRKFQDQHGLPRIRFHDLRHPYVKPTTKKLFLPARCRPLGFTALFCFFSVFSRKEIV